MRMRTDDSNPLHLHGAAHLQYKSNTMPVYKRLLQAAVWFGWQNNVCLEQRSSAVAVAVVCSVGGGRTYCWFCFGCSYSSFSHQQAIRFWKKCDNGRFDWFLFRVLQGMPSLKYSCLPQWRNLQMNEYCPLFPFSIWIQSAHRCCHYYFLCPVVCSS